MFGMKRREFMTLLGGSAAAWPLAAPTQQARKMPRIGVLMPGPLSQHSATLDAFHQGLHDLGYVNGQNIAIEGRYADWRSDRLSEVAAELFGLKVDVIVAWSTPAARAAKQATSTIPIVAAVMADPVGDELVVGLAHPGGNITGTTFLGPELVARRLQLLREVLPGLSRVAALWHPGAYGERTTSGVLKEIEVAAQTLGMQLQLVPALGPNDFTDAFSAMTRERADAFIVLPSPNVVWRAQAHRGTGGEQPTAGDVSSAGVRGRRRRTSKIYSGAPPRMWTRYSKGRSRRTCLSNDRLSSSWSST
jgi:putative ABC transport system substrate-binding protein